MRTKYRVMINGANIPLRIGKEEASALYGFYTHRYVTAAGVHEAKEQALGLVSREIARTVGKAAKAVFVVEEVIELESFGEEMVPGEGFAFYPQEPEA
jgi:hypothetical protein